MLSNKQLEQHSLLILLILKKVKLELKKQDDFGSDIHSKIKKSMVYTKLWFENYRWVRYNVSALYLTLFSYLI